MRLRPGCRQCGFDICAREANKEDRVCVQSENHVWISCAYACIQAFVCYKLHVANLLHNAQTVFMVGIIEEGRFNSFNHGTVHLYLTFILFK